MIAVTESIESESVRDVSSCGRFFFRHSTQLQARYRETMTSKRSESFCMVLVWGRRKFNRHLEPLWLFVPHSHHRSVNSSKGRLLLQIPPSHLLLSIAVEPFHPWRYSLTPPRNKLDRWREHCERSRNDPSWVSFFLAAFCYVFIFLSLVSLFEETFQSNFLVWMYSALCV